MRARTAALQALVRLDPAGFADRELAERAEARFPPAVKLITVEGGAEAVAEFADLSRTARARPSAWVPVDLPPSPGDEVVRQRLTLRAPLPVGGDLVRSVKDVTALRSARKSDGALRIRVDPEVVN